MSLLSEIEPLERKKAPRPAKRQATVPWGYGVDRVGAAAIDPYRLYVFWELTDPAIARAREELGDDGNDAWLTLRVHDTTGRIFDGTNAHGTTDQHVQRSDRRWFFVIGKPTSTAVVELGLKTAGGDFVRIARSARVEFPRREPAPPSEPEWMTVHASGAVEHAGIGRPRRDAKEGRAPSPHGPPPPPAPPSALDPRVSAGAGGAGEHAPVAWHELPAAWHAGSSESRLQGVSEPRLGGSELRIAPSSASRYPTPPETP